MTEPKTKKKCINTVKKELHNCRYCLKGFTTVYYRNRHESIHVPSASNFKCDYCDYVATLKVHLDNHLTTHNNQNPKQRPFKCTESNCDYSCNQKHYLKTHQLIHIKNDLNNPPSQLETQLKYFCSLCSYKTPRKSNLDQHLKFNHHDNKNGNTQDNKPFSCPMCPFKANRNSEVEKHVTNVHLNERAFKCPHKNCEYSGKNQWNLNQHLKTHSDSKPFVCGVEDCLFKTKWAHHLTRLEKTHLPKDEEKEFKCIFCMESFHQFSQLDTHIRIHTLEAPFSCQHCSFQGETNRKMTQHMKSHGIKIEKKKKQLNDDSS